MSSGRKEVNITLGCLLTERCVEAVRRRARDHPSSSYDGCPSMIFTSMTVGLLLVVDSRVAKRSGREATRFNNFLSPKVRGLKAGSASHT